MPKQSFAFRRLLTYAFAALLFIAASPAFAGRDDNPSATHVKKWHVPPVADVKRAIRRFTRDMAPKAAADQAAHWGIFVPETVDLHRPLVLLIHGLDSEKQDMFGLGKLLNDGGYQVGYFVYPDDQPIADSSRFFADQMKAACGEFPGIKFDIVAHSMGGLVARDYIEGNDYNGSVDRFIMVGTPNGGSTWAAGRILLEINEQFHDWKRDPQWRWTWGITDGLGEAGTDLKPHSKFLEQLNGRPRRPGVRYTIIAGNQTVTSRLSAKAAEVTLKAVPRRAANWWGVRQCVTKIERCEDHFLQKTSSSDGPVTLDSVKLTGVNDVAIVHGDHETLICFDHDHPPAAWEVIRDRLAKP